MGVTPNPDDAFYLARQFTPYDPYRVKKREPVWMGVADPDVIHTVSVPQIIDWRTVEFTPEEQLLLVANRFRRLRRFEWLARVATGEGMITGDLRPLSIANLDRGLYPDQALVDEVGRRLMQRDGQPVGEILTAITRRLRSSLYTPSGSPNPVQAAEPVATMDEYAHAVPLPTPHEENDEEALRDEA